MSMYFHLRTLILLLVSSFISLVQSNISWNHIHEGKVIIFYKSAWTNPFLHYRKYGSRHWTFNNGIEMIPSDHPVYHNSKGWWYHSTDANGIEFVFNNGKQEWDNNNDVNYDVGTPGLFLVENQNLQVVKRFPKLCHEVEDMLVSSSSFYEINKINKHANGLSIFLNLKKDGNESFLSNEIPHLQMDVIEETSHRLHVKITDRNNKRYEVPVSLLYKDNNTFQQSISNEYTFKYEKYPKFSFQILRSSTNEIIFNSLGASFIFQDQYLQIASFIPKTSHIYGLGETTSTNGLKMKPCSRRTLWNRDNPSFSSNENLYGSHPFYLQMNEDGKSHGVLLLNSNGMDISLSSNKIIFQVIGGILDFYFFLGPTPTSVVQQYTTFVGKPAMMPYWSLGFHQCRWGYKSVDELQEVVANYSNAKIPLDTMWTDIEYMDKYKDFTFDGTFFPQDRMTEFVNDLHKKNQKWIPIIDPAIMKDSNNYTTYTNGLKHNIYIEDPLSKNPYLGQVWPGPSVFPDFFHRNISKFWYDEMKQFKDIVDYDGIWIDMNEVANFCPGENCIWDKTCPDLEKQTVCCLTCSPFNQNDPLEYPPYSINNGGRKDKLSIKTLPMRARHDGDLLEYDVHNLYGLSQSIVTYQVMEKLSPKKRPFLLSRSTFVGSGKYVAKWTGDNASKWQDLLWSISSMLNLGLLGIPMAGADICGFADNASEELCARWIALGAWYPFSRNHNAKGQAPQELYRWNSVANISRIVLNMRYRLLPYWYTLNYQAHKTGIPIARPLFLVFPEDLTCRTYPAVDRQFFVGEAILVSPVVEQGVEQVRAYFPSGKWYQLFDHTSFQSNGSYFQMYTPVNKMQVHIREGTVLPLQDAGMTTYEVKDTPFELLITLPADRVYASGELFLDNGEDVKVDENSTYVQYRFNPRRFTARVVQDNYPGARLLLLEKITILGLKARLQLLPRISFVNNVNYNVEIESDFDALMDKLTIDINSKIPMNQDFNLYLY